LNRVYEYKEAGGDLSTKRDETIQEGGGKVVFSKRGKKEKATASFPSKRRAPS